MSIKTAMKELDAAEEFLRAVLKRDMNSQLTNHKATINTALVCINNAKDDLRDLELESE